MISFAQSVRWPDGDICGKPLPTYPNVRVALPYMAEFRFNAFAQRAEVRPAGIEFWREVDDQFLSELRQVTVDKFGFDPKKSNVKDATQRLCWDNQFDPVREYLEGLQWDKKRRIGTFFSEYCGACDSELLRHQARRMFAACVGRVLDPGCPFQEMGILVGEQGCNKSSLFRCLAGGAEYYADAAVFTMQQREFIEATDGKWIVEAAELAGLSETSVENVKAHLSRTHDRARLAYASTAVDRPRRFVIFGSTNQTEFLTDSTGNRRFWIIHVKEIDLDAVQRDRDQIWAESVHWYRKLGSLALPRKYWAAAAETQAAHVDGDPWDERCEAIRGDVTKKGEERIPFAVVWDEFGISMEKRNLALKRRIVGCMQRRGWTLSDVPFKFRGKAARGFRRQAPEEV